MHRLLDKAKAKAEQYMSNASNPPPGNTGFPGSGQPAPASADNNQSGELPFHTDHLYNGPNSPEHNGGRCPNFDPNFLKSQRAVYPNPGKTPPGPGKIPPKAKNIRYHDRMHFYHPRGQKHNTLRDLGFSGILDGRIVWTWGDTCMGTEDANMICAVDSTSIGTLEAPMVTQDSALQDNGINVRNWIPCNAEEEKEGGLTVNAFGGTNIVEIAPNKGIVYYLKNHRPGGNNHITGAGVATCYMGENNVPYAQRNGEKMWEETEPYWGDVGIALDEKERMIYAFGHGPQFDQEVAARTYLCRVPADHALDINAYEYWQNNKREWTKQRQGDGSNGTFRLTNDEAIFNWYVMNQSIPFWSNYFNKWMFVFGCGFPQSDLMVMTADKLEGPWDNHGPFASTKPQGHRDGFRYCMTGHPEYDPSGKTLLVTWTVNNSSWGCTIEWE